MPRRSVLPFLAVSLIWGSTWLFIKIGLAYFPPFLFAAMRLALASLLMGGYLAWRRIPLPRRWEGWWPAMLYGLLEGGGFLFVFWGELFIPSSLASVLTALSAFVVVLLSVPLLARPLELRSVGSSLLGLVGVALASTNVHAPGFAGSDTERYLGLGALVLTALFYAGATVFGKKYVKDQEPAVTSFLQMLTGTVLIFVVSLGFEPVTTPIRFSLVSLGALVYLSAVGSALAFALYFFCMKEMGASELGLLTVISPIVSIALGAVFLGESAGWHVLLGATAVLGALLWMNGISAGHRPTRGVPRKRDEAPAEAGAS